MVHTVQTDAYCVGQYTCIHCWNVCNRPLYTTHEMTIEKVGMSKIQTCYGVNHRYSIIAHVHLDMYLSTFTLYTVDVTKECYYTLQ